MSLLTLPQEVLEILFMYLDIEDLLTVWKVVYFEGSDFFWKKVCKREGYKNSLTEGSSWKRVFYNNINWITLRYVKREYEFDLPHESFGLGFHFKLVHGENLAVKSSTEVVYFWNIHQQPELISELPALFIKESRTKLLTYQSYYTHTSNAKNVVTIYSYNNNSYSEILNFENKSFSSTSDRPIYTLTDEYVASIDETVTFIRLYDLKTCEYFTIPLSNEEKNRNLRIKLEGYILYVIIIKKFEVGTMKRYNLKRRIWLDDLILLQGICGYEVKLTINSDLLVCYLSNYSTEIFPEGDAIKVWKSNGQFLKSLTYDFIRSFGIESQSVEWLIVEGEYIICSMNRKNITIWCSKDFDNCKQMKVRNPRYKAHNVISSHLLVLIYKPYFEVVDFKKATFLYVVELDRSRGLYNVFLVNEYFFVHLKQVGYCKEAVPISCGSTHANCQNRPMPYDFHNKTCKCKTMKYTPFILTIYDFRNEEIEK